MAHRRLTSVKVYGIDNRFWVFHGKSARPLPDGEALLSPALARDLESERGSQLLLRLDRKSPVPSGTVFGPKIPQGIFLRAAVRDVLDLDNLGEFSLSAAQQEVRAVFLPLTLLQRELNQIGRVNTILLSALLSARGRKPDSAAIAEALRERFPPEDAGLRFSGAEDGTVIVESDTTLISEPLAARIAKAAERLDLPLSGVSSYFVTAIQAGDRSIPYSFVAAVDPAMLPVDPDAVVLNAWAAGGLGLRPGGQVSLTFAVDGSKKG